MFHINDDNKVLPCQAVLRACPYGEDRHAERAEHLYYKIMRTQTEKKPAHRAKLQVEKLGRLMSLAPLSADIEKSDSPISTIISTLDWAMRRIEQTEPEDVQYKGNIVEQGAEAVYDVLNWGYSISSAVPAHIRREGEKLFEERNKGIYKEEASLTGNEAGIRARKRLKDLQPAFEEYRKFHKIKLSEDNKHKTLRWMRRDFYQFSHDLNTSKLLSIPLFHGSEEEVEKQIRELDDKELMLTYEDYSIGEEVINNSLYLSNNLEYKDRRDLSMAANERLQEWYKMNREILKHREKNSAKKVFIILKLVDEIDKRGLKRNDNIFYEIKEEVE